MSRYIRIKILLAAIGLAVLIWGMRIDDAATRWIGIACLAASVLMRFLPKRLRDTDYPRGPEPPAT
jgi:hypothetical protein